MFNGLTYPHMVKDFQVRAKVYDELVVSMEENHKVLKDNSLTGKSKKEMGLKKFEEVDIRSAVMGVDVTITWKIISKLFGVSNIGRFILSTKESSPEADVIKSRLFQLSEKYVFFFILWKGKEHKDTHKILLKILIGCLIPREGSTDQIS